MKRRLKKSIIDISGEKFNKLTVLEFSHMGNRHRSYWKCQCECGKIVTLCKDNFAYPNGQKSCGCWNKEQKLCKKRDKKTGRYTK
jgi:hypothetical protein